jgi:tetratricopeptide (TPR) repeat protein
MKRLRRGHPGPLSMVALLDEALAPHRRLVIERHIAGCAACRRQIAVAKELLAEGSQDVAPAIGAWLDAYLSEIPEHRWPSLVADDARLRHKVVALELSAKADSLYDRDPHKGLMYAMTATVIYEWLAASGETVAAERRAASWRDQASFMLRCGRYGEYERAIERAYELAGDSNDPEHERAVLDLSRAIAFSEPDIGRLDEAIALLKSCTPVFESRGDTKRFRIAALRRGDILMANSDIGGAADIYEALMRAASLNERAHLTCRLGWCANEAGKHAQALAMGIASRALFASQADRVQIAFADWLIGEALSRTERFSEALEVLAAAERELSQLEMWHQWISVRLTRVGTMLEWGASGNRVRDFCEEAAEVSIALDHREPSRRHNCTAEAMAFLRENARRESLTAGMVEHVRAYVRRASMRPVPRFVPPTGTAIM